MDKPASVELCAGAGGQALGLELAGFDHSVLVEIDPHACATLRSNRPRWRVEETDLNVFSGQDFRGADLLAGGLPCPPFSKAGKQLGDADERNLFPAGLRLVDEVRPKAVMFENVKGFLDPVFQEFRENLRRDLKLLGYHVDWRLLNASDFGVPQLRPRVVIVAIKSDLADRFEWPSLPLFSRAPSVGETLRDLMGSRGWKGAGDWARNASTIAPTIVGGSKKHGGPDLGPTRARKSWAALGVDGRTIAEDAPDQDYVGMPRLTVRMVARIQGFPDDWLFSGRKTAAYRQVGNAFPPPVANAVAKKIFEICSIRQSSPSAKPAKRRVA